MWRSAALLGLNYTVAILPIMRVSFVASVCVVAVPVILIGCGRTPPFKAEHEPWREASERACLARTNYQASPFVSTRSSLGAASACEVIQPFEVKASASGRVALKPAATLQCGMLAPVDQWIAEYVEPAARRHFGSPVIELRVAASYACRPRNSIWGARLSEHGRANALDVSNFQLADGRTITVRDGWHGSMAERAFLRDVHRGACQVFTTVLGPDADRFHHDHFHMDLARHAMTRNGPYRVCR